MKVLRVLLIIVAVMCIGIAVSYPIQHCLERESNDTNMETLSEMRMRALSGTANETEPEEALPASGAPEGDSGEAAPTRADNAVPEDEAARGAARFCQKP